MPRATVSASPLTKVASYQLMEGQSRLFHRLPSGLAMEVIFQEGRKVVAVEEGRRTPPLVFIHGSFHAAWCWAERWLPFFSDSGYDCYALSLLGQVKPRAASSWSKVDTLLVDYVLESANLKVGRVKNVIVGRELEIWRGHMISRGETLFMWVRQLQVSIFFSSLLKAKRLKPFLFSPFS